MSSDQLALLGVKAADVSAVENSVVAAAEARASKAEAVEQARLLQQVDAQLAALRKQEHALASARFSTATNRQLQALRTRIQTARDRRTRLVEADAARHALRESVPHKEPVTGFADASKTPRIVDGESERDFLIRTGKVTPFEGQRGYECKATEPVRRRRTKPGAGAASAPDGSRTTSGIPNVVSIDAEGSLKALCNEDKLDVHERASRSVQKRQRTSSSMCDSQSEDEPDIIDGVEMSLDLPPHREGLISVKRAMRKRPRANSDSDEYTPESSDSDAGGRSDESDRVAKSGRKRKPRSLPGACGGGDVGDEVGRKSSRKEVEDIADLEGPEGDDWVCENEEEVEFDGGLRIPASVYDRLFDYQKTGVQWLWELHMQGTGAILGDEMGLGKTIQIIAFLAALNYSGKLHGSVIVLVPATVLRQWYREFRTWWPRFRVRILHHSHSQGITKGRGRVSRFNPEAVLKEVTAQEHGVLITSYEQVRKHHELLLDKFEYVIADEGHKLKSPDAEITLVCKRFDTPHRIIVSGSPLQNHLKELWSLFDFVYPGKLGTLPVFHAQFVVPITMGAYSTASKGQVHTAFKCSVMLRDLVAPYLLKRMKKDVATQLPEKTEQILFVKLTPEQRQKYKEFLSSRFVRQVLSGRRNLLYAVTALRKICNHCDIPLHQNDNDNLHTAQDSVRKAHLGTSSLEELKVLEDDSLEDYGNWRRSGKMVVLERILHSWHEAGSKVLLFSQTKTMLDLLEMFIKDRGYKYQRMDGETAVGARMNLIDRFNIDDSIFIFLLTTRVGGLGVNLTGADRVVLFDPDWNPSTDLQARERAWRVGQKRPVTVYRLITSGTIEEKIYHRQVYKQFLTNKVLNDPRQRRFFKPKDIKDLFKLGDDGEEGTETGDIFAGTAVTETRAQREQPDSSSNDAAHEKVDLRNGDSGDAKLLNALFDDSKDGGLHSMINHDAVLDAGTDGTDVGLLEYEADKVASQAMQEVSRSAHRRRRENIGVPTWTGKSGLAGFVSAKNSVGTVSKAASVLQRIRQREGLAAQSSAKEGELSITGALLSDIIDFLKEKGGQSTSAEVVQHFQGRVDNTPNGLQGFKSMLKRVATLRKGQGPGGSAVWKLSEKVDRDV